MTSPATHDYYVASQRIQGFLEAFSRFFPNKNEVFGGEQEKESISVTIKLSRNMGFPTMS